MDYLRQFERVQRYLKRIEGQSDGSASYNDDLWSFFLNCYHLKDWIKNDSTININIRNQVEAYVDSNEYLKICADLANRSKHLELKQKSNRVDAKIRSSVTIYVGEGRSAGEHIITTNVGSEYDALVVARNALKAWEGYLKINGLI